MNEEKKAGGKDTAKRELLGLLKDSTLSPEEHEKILSIATSMDSLGTPSEDRGEHRTYLAKALLVLVALLGIALLVGAWYMLSRTVKKMDGMRSGSSSSKSVSPTDRGAKSR